MDFLKKSMVVGIVACALLVSTKSFADGGPIEKLGRGIAGIAFCWAELPIQVNEVDKDKGGIAAVTYGVLKGTCYTVLRAGVGIVDTITFFSPLPGAPEDTRDTGAGYGPLMEPAYIIDTEHNFFNFVYKDTAIMQ